MLTLEPEAFKMLKTRQFVRVNVTEGFVGIADSEV